MEKRIRTLFLSMAHIPEAVRRLVAQIRGTEFAPDPRKIAVLTEKLGLPPTIFEKQPHLLLKAIEGNEVVNTWYRTGSMLTNLADGKQKDLGIDPLFFETYKDELSEIVSGHRRSGTHVKALLIRSSRNPTLLASGTGDEETGILTQIQKVRDRLDTFIACALQSSVKTDIESASILNKLGITTSYVPKVKGAVMDVAGTIAGFAFVFIMIISVFTAYITGEFHKHFLAPLGPEHQRIFLVPSELPERFGWSWSTAAFYTTAIIGALIARQLRISARRWFDINGDTVKPPIIAYAMPIVVGTIAGCVTLVLVTNRGLSPSKVWETIAVLYLWFPLAPAIAAIALWLLDLPPGKLRNAELVRRSLVGGLWMALIGLLTAYMANNVGVENSFPRNSAPVFIKNAHFEVSVFTAFLVGIFATGLCGILQTTGLLINNARCLSSVRAKFAAAQGPEFALVLGKTGSIEALHGNGKEAASQFAQGRWLQFPEGTVVHWTDRQSPEQLDVGDSGIISSSGGQLVYEGFNGQIRGEPQFVAHLVSMSKILESTRVGAD